jgi:hypothetical protein
MDWIVPATLGRKKKIKTGITSAALSEAQNA